MHREIARNNGARIIADPSVGLEAITRQQSTFTRREGTKTKTPTAEAAAGVSVSVVAGIGFEPMTFRL